MSRLSTTLLAGVAATAAVADACIVPTGIDDGTPGSLTTADLANLPEDGIFPALIGAALGVQPGLAAFETTIQFRLVQVGATPTYNTAAAFHPTALDIWGRADESEARRRCPDTDAELLAKHRRVTLAYATSWGSVAPGFSDAFDAVLESWGLDPARCDDPAAPGCDDISTPWGLASALVADTLDFHSKDGWNADGSLNADFNKVPYSDWRENPYEPVNSPTELRRRRRWQPLQESDGKGFIYNQQHVTPHIGETARSYFLSDEKICSLRLPNPRYNLRAESELALERTDALSDRTKAEVEFFDSKLTSLVPLQVQYYARAGISLDSFEFILTETATQTALYESAIIGWKEKVRHDLVRPTSIIHKLFEGETVSSYGGPAVGESASLPGEQWQPYIRVMPHAEYPSGSSCVCKATERVLVALTGSDDVTGVLGGPLAQTIPAGSSRIEENKPAQDETFLFSKWSDITARCGISRLNGGMHFTAAVPDGEELCGPVGDIVAAAFKKLVAGEQPDYVTPFDAPADLSGRRCRRNGRPFFH